MTPQQEALVDELEVVRAQTQADKDATAARDRVMGAGPVYQGVAKQIRRLTASGTFADLEQIIDPDEHAGTIALARSVARAVDKLTGHNPTGWVANGRDLAPLVEQLSTLLAMLGADKVEEDPFTKFLGELNDKDSDRGDTPAPHDTL